MNEELNVTLTEEQRENISNMKITRNIYYYPMETTMDYDNFGRYYENREIIKDKKYQILLSQLAKTNGNIDAALISASNKIIDGQNRREGCKDLNIPFRFVKTDITDEEAIMLIKNINSAQRKFGVEEQARTNMKMGIPGYYEYINLKIEKYFPWSAVQALAKVKDEHINNGLPLVVHPRILERRDFVVEFSRIIKEKTKGSPDRRGSIHSIQRLEKAYEKRRKDIKLILPINIDYERILRGASAKITHYGIGRTDSNILDFMSLAFDSTIHLKKNKLELNRFV